MADENGLAVPVDLLLVRDDGAMKCLGKVGTDVEIVVPLDKVEFCPPVRQLAQFFQQRNIRGEHQMFITDPELKNVAKQEQGVNITLPVEKIE